MKNYEDAKVRALPFEVADNFDTTCRGLGPIKPKNNLTIAQFISKAFNDEFFEANIYDPNGTPISGKITRIEMSSTNGLWFGYWDIEILVKGSGGKELLISHKHEFETAYLAQTACNMTSEALNVTVQELIRATTTHRDFYLLLGLF